MMGEMFTDEVEALMASPSSTTDRPASDGMTQR